MQAVAGDQRADQSAEPFLKWAGGKRLLLPKLLDRVQSPDPECTYFEPFVGGGAVFFALLPKKAVLADLNEELMETYTAVREEVEEVIRFLEPLEHDRNSYYRIRQSKPRKRASRAARFIYLNKTCFNGLYRVNAAGNFNVPFGQHGQHLQICDTDQLRRASVALRGAVLQAADFAESVAAARSGDTVYLDPPYTTAHSNNGFIEYNAKVFSWHDQGRLAELAKELVTRGATVVISNANHPSIRELYGQGSFQIQEIHRFNTMAGKSAARFPAAELMIIGGS